MKKLVALILVLGLATMANAALTLSVGTDTLDPAGTTTISISGDGTTPGGSFYLGVSAGGPGSVNLDIAPTWNYTGDTQNTTMYDDSDAAAGIGFNNPFVVVEMGDYPLPPAVPDPLNGLLVSGIGFTCLGAGDVTLLLLDGGDLSVLSSVVIHQVPEPITLALLGLGGLFIRRK